jgi:DNA-binding NarL/FixJ family response regulator
MSELDLSSFSKREAESVYVPPIRRAVLVEDIAEFHDVVLNSLVRLPGTWSLSSFFNGQDALDFSGSMTVAPDVVLVDLGLPDVDGTLVVKRFRQVFPEVPVLVYTVFSQQDKVSNSFEAGASGYVLKDDDVFCTATAIRKAMDGFVPISPAVGRYVLSRGTIPVNDVGVAGLSEREKLLLQYLAKGFTYVQAAHEMGLKLSTVHSYSKNLFRKLGVSSRSQAIARLFDMREG